MWITSHWLGVTSKLRQVSLVRTGRISRRAIWVGACKMTFPVSKDFKSAQTEHSMTMIYLIQCRS